MRPALCALRNVTAWHGLILSLTPFAVRNSGSGSDFVSIILIQKTPFSRFLVASRVSSGNKKNAPALLVRLFRTCPPSPGESALRRVPAQSASLRLIAHGCKPPCSAFGFAPPSGSAHYRRWGGGDRYLIYNCRIVTLQCQKFSDFPKSPAPVWACENAWHRSGTSQQRTGADKGDCG
jgi:hypothetical protein